MPSIEKKRPAILKSSDALPITPQVTVEHSNILLDQMVHVQVPMCNRFKQPQEAIVFFFVIAIQTTFALPFQVFPYLTRICNVFSPSAWETPPWLLDQRLFLSSIYTQDTQTWVDGVPYGGLIPTAMGSCEWLHNFVTPFAGFWNSSSMDLLWDCFFVTFHGVTHFFRGVTTNIWPMVPNGIVTKPHLELLQAHNLHAFLQISILVLVLRPWFAWLRAGCRFNRRHSCHHQIWPGQG